MRARSIVRLCLPVTLIVVCLTLLQIGISADKTASDKKKPTPVELLGGADRYLTHVSTDKPIYRPGETVYIRGTVLHAGNRRPLDDTKQVAAQIQVTGPKGNIVSSGWVKSDQSVLGFAWKVPAEQTGGQYFDRHRRQRAGNDRETRTGAAAAGDGALGKRCA